MNIGSTYKRDEALTLGLDLVRFLKERIKNTRRRTEWSERNFKLLRQFAKSKRAKSYPARTGSQPKSRAKQFLWDFIADLDGQGILLAAESEYIIDDHAIKEDFQKLLYVRSPVKLMMCRVKSQQNADVIKDSLNEFISDACSWLSPGEVYVLYCVWWAGADGQNRDIAYTLQCKGELNYVGITTEKFQSCAMSSH